MMLIKLATTTTCFGPSYGHLQVVHLPQEFIQDANRLCIMMMISQSP